MVKIIQKLKLPNKKSQAAMEFLMTYGWAILVVLAAIGALAYFGVLNYSRFVPEHCMIAPTSGLACLDSKITTDTAYLYISNTGGRDFQIINISLGDCSFAFNNSLENGEAELFNLTGCAFGEREDKIKADIIIHYTDMSYGLEKTSSGSITSLVSN